MYPRQLLVARVTWPCVNTLPPHPHPPEGQQLSECILPWLCRFSSFSLTSGLTKLHTCIQQRRERAGRQNNLGYWLTVRVESLMFPQVFLCFTCIAVKPGLCLGWFALKGPQLFALTLSQYILHNPALLQMLRGSLVSAEPQKNRFCRSLVNFITNANFTVFYWVFMW